MNPVVSDSQEVAISAGLRRGEKSWRRLPLDVQAAVPDWALDLHIDFRDGWGNLPEVQLHLAYDPLSRAGVSGRREDLKPAWKFLPEPRAYVGEAEGMAGVHYHEAPKCTMLSQFEGYETGEDGKPNYNKPLYSKYSAVATPESDGYCGRTFLIRMASDSPSFPGEIVHLRGPWHGGAPEGFIEVHCHVKDKEADERRRQWAAEHHPDDPSRQAWHNLGLTFGWYVRREVLFAISAAKQPSLEWAEVNHGNWLRLEPIDPRTGCPKGFTPAQEIKG